MLDPLRGMDAMRQSFMDHSREHGAAQRVRSDLPGAGTAVVLFPGTAPGLPVYSVKVHAKFPAEQPAIRGVLLLHDAMTGALLCVMDSTLITAVRTALAGALAAKSLARADSRRVAIIGAGEQGRWQLRLLSKMYPLTGSRHSTRQEGAPQHSPRRCARNWGWT